MLASISRHARARHCLNTKRKAAPIAEGGYRLFLQLGRTASAAAPYGHVGG
jgi:hypothetical protein